MFEFNHILSFPGSACYYAELLGLLVEDFFSIFFVLFSFPTDRPRDPKSRNAFDSKQKNVNGLRGSTSKQHTINFVPRRGEAVAYNRLRQSEVRLYTEICKFK